MIFAIDAIALFVLLAFASYVLTTNVREKSFLYAIKWMAIPSVAIYAINILNPAFEFTALGLLAVAVAALASILVRVPATN